MNKILSTIKAEAAAAQLKFGDFTSAHEAAGVLVEEMAELMTAIRDNDRESVKHEAIQVAAVAASLAECCGHEDFDSRSMFRP